MSLETALIDREFSDGTVDANGQSLNKVLEIDTLALTRRGREEQARVIRELVAAGVGRLARFIR